MQINGMLVLPVRIELTTSALPRMRSTTELRQHARRAAGGGLRAASGGVVKPGGAAVWSGMGDLDKTERLARALRENLRRRKAQAREVPPPAEQDAPEPNPADDR